VVRADSMNLRVRGTMTVEVAGIEPVRTVGTRRDPSVASTTYLVPSGPIGSRWVRPLTPSTPKVFSESATP